MRLLALCLAIPAALAVNLRSHSSDALNSVPPPPAAKPATEVSKAPDGADCVSVAKKTIDQAFKDFSEMQDVLSSLPDGSKCTLDQKSIDTAQGKVNAAQQAKDAADDALKTARDAKAPCCEVPLSELEAAKNDGSAGKFPASLASCTQLKDSIENMKKLEGEAAAQPAILNAANANLADTKKSANDALNKCICDAEDHMNEAFAKAEQKEKTKGPEREKTLLLEKAVICAKENSDKGGAVDACDNLVLTPEEKEKLTLKKPTMAAGKVCKRAPVAPKPVILDGTAPPPPPAPVAPKPVILDGTAPPPPPPAPVTEAPKIADGTAPPPAAPAALAAPPAV